MKKARIIMLATAVTLVLLCLLGWLFWSLGSIKAPEEPVLRLVVEQGSVFIQSGAGLEEQAKSGMLLNEGDVIRTANNANATVTVAGRSDLRLGENTQIKIDKAVIRETRDFNFGFSLISGRAWSRVMKLLDFENIYESRTDNVVATVRGTAFGLTKTNEGVLLFVDKAAVGMGSVNQNNENIFTKDEWAFFDNGGGLINRGNIYSTSSAVDWAWAEQERIADQRFEGAAKKYLLDTLRGGKGYAPDDWKSALSRMSEKWHLRFSGDKCVDLRARYFGRELYFVYDLMERGKSGLAYQYFTDLQKRAHDDFENDKCADKVKYADQAGTMLLALSGVNPESEMYKLKLRMEEMYISFFEEHSAQAFWAHALALDSRLDELERFDCKNDLRGSMQQSLDAVTQGILRQDRDFELLPADLDAKIKMILVQKTFVQNTRKNNFLESLENCKKQPINGFEDDQTATSTTSTEMENATSTSDEQTNASEEGGERVDGNTGAGVDENQQRDPIQTDQTAVLNLARIELFAQPNPVNKGSTSILYVKGIKKDGSEFDATKYAVFQYTGSLGVISGNVFTANQTGTANITARVTDNGQQYISEVSLNINDPWILSRLTAAPVYGNRVRPGDSKQITATAFYTNGQNRDVSAFADYSLSDNGMGTMIGSTFRSSANAYGQVVITIRYEEGGVILDDQVVLDIVYD
jgi:hypothetical protein